MEKRVFFWGVLWGYSDDFWSFFVTLGHIDFVLATLGHFGVILWAFSGVIFPSFAVILVISGCVGTYGANECHFFHIPCRCYVGLFSVCASVLRWKNRRLSNVV